MKTVQKGDRMSLLAHPQTHGTVWASDGTVMDIIGDGCGDVLKHGQSYISLVPFPVGTKVRKPHWSANVPSEEVIEELGGIRFLKGINGNIEMSHISELRAAEEAKWVPKEGDTVYRISTMYSDGCRLATMELRYKREHNEEAFALGLIRQTREEAERAVEAMIKAAKETI